MRHPQADLLIYAAENADAQFYCEGWYESSDINRVIRNPELNWKIHPKTITKWQWAYQIDNEVWVITKNHYLEFPDLTTGSNKFNKLTFTAKEFLV